MTRASDDGSGTPNFSVPEKAVLVINKVHIFPLTLGAGTISLELRQQRPEQSLFIRSRWLVPRDQPTQLDFPTGFVIGPGHALSIRNLDTSDATVRVRIYGYLAKDR